MVKNLPVMQETVHSSILVWKVPIDRGAWWAASPCGRKELDTTGPLALFHFPVLYYLREEGHVVGNSQACSEPQFL